MLPEPDKRSQSAVQIARWGNSLAVRLPAAVVRELGLREGDEVEIVALQRDRWAARPAEVPADFRLDREQAHERA